MPNDKQLNDEVILFFFLFFSILPPSYHTIIIVTTKRKKEKGTTRVEIYQLIAPTRFYYIGWIRLIERKRAAAADEDCQHAIGQLCNQL
jgi:hypothetical protein